MKLAVLFGGKEIKQKLRIIINEAIQIYGKNHFRAINDSQHQEQKESISRSPSGAGKNLSWVRLQWLQLHYPETHSRKRAAPERVTGRRPSETPLLHSLNPPVLTSKKTYTLSSSFFRCSIASLYNMSHAPVLFF